jgi:hypothetical protein
MAGLAKAVGQPSLYRSPIVTSSFGCEPWLTCARAKGYPHAGTLADLGFNGSPWWSAVLQHFTTPGHEDRLRRLTAPQFLRCETRSLSQRG